MNAPSSKPAIAELTVAANGLDVHALACGPDDGPLVLLLHGFPECALGWRHQLTALGAAGLRAVAPDQRGYGGTDKPIGVRAYAIDRLADDIVELAAALGQRRFMLVGHDWGGIVAWHLASTRPSSSAWPSSTRRTSASPRASHAATRCNGSRARTSATSSCRSSRSCR